MRYNRLVSLVGMEEAAEEVVDVEEEATTRTTTDVIHHQIQTSAVVHSDLLHHHLKFRLLAQLRPISPSLQPFQRDLKQKCLVHLLARYLVFQSLLPRECVLIPLGDREKSLYLQNGSILNMP
jgi:hypothetical protein